MNNYTCSSQVVFVTDLDGTLLNDDGVVSDFTLHAFSVMRYLKIPIIISTGRNRHDMQNCLGPLPSFENVAITYCNGRHIIGFDGSETTQPGVSWQDCLTLLREFRTAGIHYFTRESNYAVKGTATWKLFAKKLIGKNTSLELVNSKTMLKDAELDRIDKVWLICGDRQIVCDKLNFMLVDDVAAVINHGEVIEIINQDSTKFVAVKMLLDFVNCPEKKVIVFGDDQNDITLFETPFFERCAVSNAVSDIKELADRIVDSNNNDGVARAMFDYASVEGVTDYV